MTRRGQFPSDEAGSPAGWQAVAASFPLIGSETPHYLRRFSYVHNDRVFTFDEGPSESLQTNKRVSIGMPTDGPAPKRREKELEPRPAPEAELALELSSDTEEAEPPSIESPHARQYTPHPGDAFPEPALQAAVDGEPALPSPTASPRSPGSPLASEDASAPEANEVPDSAAIMATPRTTTDIQGLIVSARAFAPAGGNFPGASQSPLLAFHRPPPGVLTLQQQPFPELFDASADDIASRVAAITHSFESLPQGLRRYQLFNLFRGCNRSTLSAMFNELEQALRFDILSNIPPELSSLVLRHLDVDSVVAAAQVSKSWYRLVDSDELLWQSLLEREAVHSTSEDLQRALREKWGYEGWATPSNPNLVQPRNAFGLPVNVYKAIFRRLALIHRNWMNPNSRPRQYNIQCPSNEVITCVDFSDDIIIASTDGANHLNVYDTQTGVLLNAFTSHEGGVWALKRVGKDQIVSGSIDHTVRVWSLKKNRCTHVFRGHRATVRCLDVVMPTDSDPSRDYPVILTGSRDATLRLWRLPGPDDPEYTAYTGDTTKDSPYFLAVLRGHEESVRAVSGHGTVAVSGSYDFKVRIWDLVTHTCKHVLEGHDNKVYATLIDPDRNRCLSASLDFHIKIWDLDTGAQLYSLDGHTGLVGLLGLRDNTLVSAAADKTLRVWNPEDGRLEHRLDGHDSAILCFDHDRRRLVSGSAHHLKLWDPRTGRFVRDLLTDVENIWQVSFDSRRCIAAVSRGRPSQVEILDFDYDPSERPSDMSDRIEEL